MFVAMNRFRIVKGHAGDFEEIWQTRDSHLKDVPGFKSFNLLRGPEKEDHILYASHSIWESQAAFEAWTRSEAFRKAHAGAGERRNIYLGHPEFEGFNTVANTGA
ncbi:MAG: antibiotic biosynthesis monooxygenase [Caulobacterales bacterium]